MSRKGKIKLVLILSSIYFIIFFSNNEIKMNMGKITSNENKIAQLKEQKILVEEKLEEESAEYELYNNDVNNYISLINNQTSLAGQIDDIKKQIDDYQAKIANFNAIIKDN